MSEGNVWERLVVDSDITLPEEFEKIPIHEFASSVRLYVFGSIVDTLVIDSFALDENGQSDLDDFKTSYDTIVLRNDKQDWIAKLESCFLLYNFGMVSEMQAKTILGIP